MKRWDVTALGELLIDFTEKGYSPEGNPLLEANPGGAPANVLAMLARLGHSGAFIGKVGSDMFGDHLESALAEAGIDTGGLVRDKSVPTTLAFVHTAQNGERSFSFYRSPGADMNLTEEELDTERLTQGRIFHFGSLGLTDEPVRSATHKALQIAEENGVLRSYDPNLRPPLWSSDELAREQILWGMAHCDMLKIADNEIQWLSGKEDFDEGIAWLREQFDIKLICLTLGPDGSRVYYGKEKFDVAPFLQENTIETTGAGDTFCACMINAVLETGIDNFTAESLKGAVTFANAAASIITTRKGALKSMPEKQEVIDFLQKIGK